MSIKDKESFDSIIKDALERIDQLRTIAFHIKSPENLQSLIDYLIDMLKYVKKNLAATDDTGMQIFYQKYSEVIRNFYNYFMAVAWELKEHQDLNFTNVWNTGQPMVHSQIVSSSISAMQTSIELMKDQGLADKMHKEKSGEGGRVKAERERKEKLSAIRPLLDELKNVRFSGKYKNHRDAVIHILANDERFELIARQDGDRISIEKFIMPLAKKEWKECVKPGKSK